MLRCLYVDLDGTLLGKGASMFHDENGDFTLLGARALEACDRAGVEVVIYSGRREAQVHEDARLIGSTAYIFEAGAGLVVDGEREWLTGGIVPGELSIHDQIEASGAPALLLERYPRRLEYHEPWHRNREVSHLFRGKLDAFEADTLLRENGHDELRLVDNGAIHRQTDTLDIEWPAHAYHLVPRAASKAGAVARHMRNRGYVRAECIAVGDSREDLGAADAVGTFWFVANAVERDPSLRLAAADQGNARIAEARHGAGVYEAVVTTLAERG
jgi:hydroxymethylpyrimidine pyrophosphatase-like HAD family hydrolase